MHQCAVRSGPIPLQVLASRMQRCHGCMREESVSVMSSLVMQSSREMQWLQLYYVLSHIWIHTYLHCWRCTCKMFTRVHIRKWWLLFDETNLQLIMNWHWRERVWRKLFYKYAYITYIIYSLFIFPLYTIRFITCKKKSL